MLLLRDTCSCDTQRKNSCPSSYSWAPLVELQLLTYMQNSFLQDWRPCKLCQTHWSSHCKLLQKVSHGLAYDSYVCIKGSCWMHIWSNLQIICCQPLTLRSTEEPTGCRFLFCTQRAVCINLMAFSKPVANSQSHLLLGSTCNHLHSNAAGAGTAST